MMYVFEVLFMKEIRITEIEGFRFGNAEYEKSATGCTVILADPGAVTGIDIRGGAPASRESGLLNPLADNSSVNAVLLSGGSAFGLSAADGIMKYLEERNIGFPTDAGVVPIVCASCLFDLGFVDSKVRPDSALGYQACLNAEKGIFQEGSYGAGCGATVGKVLGPASMMKAGLGTYAVQAGDLKVGAIVAVNAVGDIYDTDGKKIAGVYDPKTGEFVDAAEALIKTMQAVNLFRQNTTIGAIITNAGLNKTALSKVAGMAHDGFARAIRPVHTMFDGDTVYAMSNGSIPSDINTVGVLAAEVMAKAIARAARPEGPSYGIRKADAEVK